MKHWSSVLSQPAPAIRDGALDAFRGIAVVGMVIVNLQGDDNHAFVQLAHSPWHGVTIADLVFPFFILAVGLSTPLAIRPEQRRQWAGLCRRTAMLLLIGMVIGWLLHPSLALAEFRFTGVLQRIAVVYLCCAALCIKTPGVRPAIGAAAILLAVHALLLTLPLIPSAPPSLLPGEGLSSLLDRLLLPGRLLRGTHDPEGVLSTLSAIATAMLGVAVQRLRTRAAHPNRVIAQAALFCIGLSLLLALWIPFNKPLWTPSYALLASGLGLALWAALRLGWRRIADVRWVRGTAILGQIALTLFVVHMVIVALLLVRMSPSQNLWAASFAVLAAIPLPVALSSLVYAVVGGAVSIAISLWLRQRGWLIKA